MFFNHRLGNQFSSYYSPLLRKPGINWSNILNNTQKTLGIINQAIPICYQIGPIYRNAKTMFRVASEINKTNNTTTNNYYDSSEKYSDKTNNPTNNYDDSGPNFFI
ncbi:MAG: VrrA/YqfQ family protein [Bacilli bacterium]|nr:VrrA/YqfQ family protein [Bacilli bacterium]